MNKSDYEFWSREVKNLFDNEEQKILEENNALTFWSDLQEVAKIRLLKELEIYTLYNECQELSNKIKELNELRGDLYNKLVEIIKPELVGTYNTPTDYNDFLLSWIVDKKGYIKDLAKASDVGVKILKLRAEQNSYLKTLVILTSKKEMREFIIALYKKFDIELIDLGE